MIANKIILNTRIDIIDLNNTLILIENWCKEKSTNYICCVPIHTIMNCHDDNNVSISVNSSNINTPDGMGVVWILRTAGHKNASRVYGPDLMYNTCKMYPNLRHYFLGGTQEILSNLEKQLKSEIPEVNVVGHCSPKVSREKLKVTEEVKNSILDKNPEIIWVGLGSPKQELWMYQNYKQFPGVVMIGVGAAFDFLSGNKPQAPRWIQRSGFEWLYRFFQEPRRLWKRYLLGYPRFVVLIFIELFKKRILKQ